MGLGADRPRHGRPRRNLEGHVALPTTSASSSSAPCSRAASAPPPRTTSPAITVTVYRYALATQEGGPAVNGHKTACGQTFRPSIIGTANRTLPCGEKVALYYHGRTLVVPVIDRGPYAHGADFDISIAAAKKLGLDGISKIGAVSLPPAPSSITNSRRR